MLRLVILHQVQFGEREERGEVMVLVVVCSVKVSGVIMLSCEAGWTWGPPWVLTLLAGWLAWFTGRADTEH